MPISSFMGLQTSLRGLIAHQQALNTTGHNLANANTVGFSRQEAVLAAMPALTLPVNSGTTGYGAQLGTGVDVLQIRRIRDSFLDIQYRAESMQLGNAATKSQSLEQAELAFAEPSVNGINQLLGRFWSAWSDLAQAPESDPARTNVVRMANTLASAFQTVYDQLTTVATQATDEYNSITGPAGDVEVWARELAQLNDTISHAVAVGQSPNDLMDRRDFLIDRLSELAQVSVRDLGTGALRVDFGGVTLVDPAAAGGYTWPQTLTSPGGKLGALQDLGSPTGPALTYRARLDAIVADFVTRVNGIHAAPTGVNFFDPAGTTADRIAVVVTARTVVTSSDGTSGRNDVANAIAQLRGGSIDRSYSSLVGEVGSDVKGIRNSEAVQQALVDAIEDRRQSVQGVSPDEEMTNLIRFQRGYQASARTMTTLDDMLDTLINRTGKVGL
ncbi:flagellar hook-associated protein FlgK [Conexibacter sp. JD483]|uniref:flagellar hook-associated protein FlgK n=1 Tax=unclassified Conexibacter TaxID=2627773 RepID=UPI002724B1D8|nr:MULTISPECIES: flagellar hook-associated protein FlgK [unclassified Conexibacter]MDO8184467.1 flagellar hook-associated protein FlgK [Conexibacter sp. CPCC 205706]MDO8197773.1 flagellar hook-associated protein FlgK [Conexibacter sp. CPCC 205762]MDR9368091.1 flagellar hook-associated protein FlgK [Conexibacter sp. JD483]